MDNKAKLEHLAQGMRVEMPVLFLKIYEWRYGKITDVSNDYVLFVQLGIIPSYVEDFLREVDHAKR
jgi:hypothetical protein